MIVIPDFVTRSVVPFNKEAFELFIFQVVAKTDLPCFPSGKTTYLFMALKQAFVHLVPRDSVA